MCRTWSNLQVTHSPTQTSVTWVNLASRSSLCSNDGVSCLWVPPWDPKGFCSSVQWSAVRRTLQDPVMKRSPRKPSPAKFSLVRRWERKAWAAGTWIKSYCFLKHLILSSFWTMHPVYHGISMSPFILLDLFRKYREIRNHYMRIFWRRGLLIDGSY